MSKNKVSEWSTTAASNTDISGIDIAEGCAPSGINNAIREMMAQVKDMQAGTDGDNFTVGGNLSVTGTTTATGAITANGGVTGNLTGNVTGNLTGNVTGNADTATTATNLSATLAVNKGGTGVTTSTGTGNVVLSDSPTLVTPALGTPSALVATNASGTANNLNAGIGVNQTWQIVTGSRAFGTTYTNSSGKPIMVFISCYGSGINTITVGGVAIGSFQANASAVNSNASFIVPEGATYVVSTGATLAKWSELR